MSVSDGVDQLDLSLFDSIGPALGSSADRRSLLALHAALGGRGSFGYLEVGSYLGASLQAFIADPRCRTIVSIDTRDDISQDARRERPEYPGNSTANMLAGLSRVPEADLTKLATIDAGTDRVDPREATADLCLIDAEHTDAAALQDARFCRRVLRNGGVIVFHDRTLVDGGIRRFLAEVPGCRAYPLAHEMFVVELDAPSLLSDPRVRAQVPRRAWLVADRLGAMRAALWLASVARRLEAACGRLLLARGAPRRRGRAAPAPGRRTAALFEIYTFVNDDKLYAQMVDSFADVGFSRDAVVALSDVDDDPYTAITRIGRETRAQYPILCHQDVRTNLGFGAAELAATLRRLDGIDPGWVVAGNAGCMRNGRGVRRLVDFSGGATGGSLPAPVVTLDENFLVFNGRQRPRCSEEIGGFHLYGTDVCLHALRAGGGAYVIDFPVTHLGGSLDSGSEAVRWADFDTVTRRFVEVWSRRLRFCYLVTPITGVFVSRSPILRRLFGSPLAMTCIARAVQAVAMRRE
jgi:Methyltransferase domain